MAGKVIKKSKVLKEQLARALADYDNLVKRFEREKEEVIKRSNRALLEDLLPVFDNLNRAQEHLGDQGLKMALDQFLQILNNYGVEEVPAVPGDKFDSQLHEAIESIAGDSAEQNGTIAEVLARGWKWQDGMVLRPAKVKVYGEKQENGEIK